MTTKLVGFACKWIDHAHQVDGISPKDDCKRYNTGTTTVAWLNRQTRGAAEDRLWTLLKGNIESVRLLVARVASLPPPLRMVRLSSDILPVYTHADWRYFYRQPDVIAYMERYFAVIGDCARAHGVRLSFHPGQFTVLGSENPNIVESSIEEFEYHVDMARWMGYGRQFGDFKINIHISGKRGPQGFRLAYNRLTPEARNTITVENEENTWGLDDCLSLMDICPTVLDVHHHYCKTGEYIESTDPRIQMVIDSWRGRRPVIHYSQSREEYLAGHPSDKLPNRDILIAGGTNKQKLRAHSDFFHNVAMNQWMQQHWQWGDIMCESKAKNLASTLLYESWTTRRDSSSSVPSSVAPDCHSYDERESSCGVLDCSF